MKLMTRIAVTTVLATGFSMAAQAADVNAAPAPAQEAEPVVMHTTVSASAQPVQQSFVGGRSVVHTATGTPTLAAVKCDGDHGGPMCADPECWNGGVPQKAEDDGSRINIGQIKEKIAPLSIDAAGLEELGFPVVETIKGSKMYREVDLVPMIAAMMRKLRAALEKAEAPF